MPYSLTLNHNIWRGNTYGLGGGRFLDLSHHLHIVQMRRAVCEQQLVELRVKCVVRISICRAGGSQKWDAGSDSSNVKTAARSVGTTDQQDNENILTYPGSPRGSRVLDVPAQPPPPPPAPTVSRRGADNPPADGQSSCWRPQQRAATTHVVCTLPHGRRPPAIRVPHHHPLWGWHPMLQQIRFDYGHSTAYQRSLRPQWRNLQPRPSVYYASAPIGRMH